MSNYTQDAAIKALKDRGVSFFVGDDGRISFRKVGDTKIKIDGPNAPDPALAYENCNHNSETWRSARKSHAPEPKSTGPIGDAARISNLSADMKRYAADQALKSRSFAELTKAKSQALWQGRNPKPLAVRHG